MKMVTVSMMSMMGAIFSPRNRPIDEGKNEMSPKKIESLQEWSQKEVVATELVILNGYMNNPDTNEYWENTS